MIVSQRDRGWTQRWTTKSWDGESDNKKRDEEARRNKSAGGVYNRPLTCVCVCVYSLSCQLSRVLCVHSSEKRVFNLTAMLELLR